MNLSEGTSQPILIHLIDTANFPKDKSCLSLGGQQIGGKEKEAESQVHKSMSVKRLKSPPQAVPLRRYMVVDGLGVAGTDGVQVILDQEILRLLVIAVLSSVEWVRTGTLVGNCELTGLVGGGVTSTPLNIPHSTLHIHTSPVV